MNKSARQFPELALGGRFRLAQKADLATHLLPHKLAASVALCGVDVGPYPSWDDDVKIGKDGLLLNNNGLDCRRYLDCKNCQRLLSKQHPPTSSSV